MFQKKTAVWRGREMRAATINADLRIGFLRAGSVKVLPTMHASFPTLAGSANMVDPVAVIAYAGNSHIGICSMPKFEQEQKWRQYGTSEFDFDSTRGEKFKYIFAI